MYFFVVPLLFVLLQLLSLLLSYHFANDKRKCFTLSPGIQSPLDFTQ